MDVIPKKGSSYQLLSTTFAIRKTKKVSRVKLSQYHVVKKAPMRCLTHTSTSTLLIQFSLELLQLIGVRQSSILTLLCYELVERVMNTFLIQWAPDRRTHGHEDRNKDRKEGG